MKRKKPSRRHIYLYALTWNELADLVCKKLGYLKHNLEAAFDEDDLIRICIENEIEEG